MQGLDITDLPQTYQDAIEITRQLNIRYLWADSLCIIQDDARDWRKKSALTGDVYKHGFLNISAVAAADMRTGIYVPRDSSKCGPLLIQETTSLSQSDGSQWAVIQKCFWQDAVDWNHLNARGWVLQERVLAPRTIYYTKGFVHWECRSMGASEIFPHGLPSSFGFRSSLRMSPFKQLILGRSLDCYDKKATMFLTTRYWQKLLLTYLHCNLTYEQDRLIALSGPTREFHRILKTDYLAGFWRDQLPLSLIWHIMSNPKHPPKRFQEYVAPSWSWASTTGHVLTPLNEYRVPELSGKDLLTILEIDLRLVNGEDPFGQIVDGHMIVRGHLGGASGKT